MGNRQVLAAAGERREKVSVELLLEDVLGDCETSLRRLIGEGDKTLE